MERTAELYKLYAELTVVKKGIEELAARRPNPREWTQEEVAHQKAPIPGQLTLPQEPA